MLVLHQHKHHESKHGKSLTVKCESTDGARVTPEGHEERRSLRPVGARADNPWFDPQSLDFKATGRRAPDIVFDAAHPHRPMPGRSQQE